MVVSGTRYSRGTECSKTKGGVQCLRATRRLIRTAAVEWWDINSVAVRINRILEGGDN